MSDSVTVVGTLTFASPSSLEHARHLWQAAPDSARTWLRLSDESLSPDVPASLPSRAFTELVGLLHELSMVASTGTVIATIATATGPEVHTIVARGGDPVPLSRTSPAKKVIEDLIFGRRPRVEPGRVAELLAEAIDHGEAQASLPYVLDTFVRARPEDVPRIARALRLLPPPAFGVPFAPSWSRDLDQAVIGSAGHAAWRALLAGGLLAPETSLALRCALFRAGQTVDVGVSDAEMLAPVVGELWAYEGGDRLAHWPGLVEALRRHARTAPNLPPKQWVAVWHLLGGADQVRVLRGADSRFAAYQFLAPLRAMRESGRISEDLEAELDAVYAGALPSGRGDEALRTWEAALMLGGLCGYAAGRPSEGLIERIVALQSAYRELHPRGRVRLIDHALRVFTPADRRALDAQLGRD